MKNNQSGTQKFCPTCKAIRVVKSVPPAPLGRIPSQRVYHMQHDDLSFFRRGQECQTCWNQWLSAELPETFIHELAKLRDELSVIKRAAEAANSKESEDGSLRLA